MQKNKQLIDTTIAAASHHVMIDIPLSDVQNNLERYEHLWKPHMVRKWPCYVVYQVLWEGSTFQLRLGKIGHMPSVCLQMYIISSWRTSSCSYAGWWRIRIGEQYFSWGPLELMPVVIDTYNDTLWEKSWSLPECRLPCKHIWTACVTKSKPICGLASCRAMATILLRLGNCGGKQGCGNRPRIDDRKPYTETQYRPLKPPKRMGKLSLNWLANARDKPIRKFSIDPTSSIQTSITPFLWTPFLRLLLLFQQTPHTFRPSTNIQSADWANMGGGANLWRFERLVWKPVRSASKIVAKWVVNMCLDCSCKNLVCVPWPPNSYKQLITQRMLESSTWLLLPKPPAFGYHTQRSQNIAEHECF